MTRRKRTGDETTELVALPLADDWTPAQTQGVTDGPTWREHRHQQVERTLAFLYVRAHGDPAADAYSVKDAANMLRALPGARYPNYSTGGC